METEQYFRRLTSTPGLPKVDIAGFSQESISDCDVLSNYKLIFAEAELEPDKHVEKDVLHNLVSLSVPSLLLRISSSGTKLNQSRQRPSLSERKLVEVAKTQMTKGMNRLR